MSSSSFEVAKAKTLNGKLRLDDIGLVALEAKLLRSGIEPKLSFSISLDGIEWILEDNHIHAAFPVSVTLDDVSKERVALAEIRLVFRASYGLDAAFDRSQDLEASNHFLAIVGWLQVWPYVRSEVQQLSSRLGFPALVLHPLLAGQTSNVEVRQVTREAKPQKRAARKASAVLDEGTTSEGPKSPKAAKRKHRADR